MGGMNGDDDYDTRCCDCKERNAPECHRGWATVLDGCECVHCVGKRRYPEYFGNRVPPEELRESLDRLMTRMTRRTETHCTVTGALRSECQCISCVPPARKGR